MVGQLFCARCDAPGTGSIDDLPDDWERHVSGMTGAEYAVCSTCVEGSAGKSIRSDGGGNTDNQLRLFMERLERLAEEKKGVADDMRDVFAEARAQGYDTKIMREVLRLRAMDPHNRAEHQALLDTYLVALGLA